MDLLLLQDSLFGARSIVQVVEHLPSMHEILDSIPNTTKKRGKERFYLCLLTL
jgi:hypothetical protein